jgi:hypothetical protein
MLGKLNHYLARVSIFLVAAALIAGTVGCDGNGSQNLEIRTWYDLDAIRDKLSGNYTLMKDLDSTTAGYEELAIPTANGGKGWQPIGTRTDYGFDGLLGTFDGQGHEIRDMFINRPDERYVGLFGAIGQDGVIKDISVMNITATGYENVGGLVGNNGGIVSNSYSAGCVTGEWHVGGLVGRNYGTVSNSFWDTETSGQATSDGGTGKTTAEMQDIATFSGAGWNIIAVANPSTRNPSYIWNIVDDETYPFLSWQFV